MEGECKGARFSTDHIMYCECGWSQPMTGIATGMYASVDPKKGYPPFMEHAPRKAYLGTWAWLWCHPNELSAFRRL